MSSLAGQSEVAWGILMFNMNMWLPAPLPSTTPSPLWILSQSPTAKFERKHKMSLKQIHSLQWLFTCWFLERTPVGLSCPERPCERLKRSSEPLLWCPPADWWSPTHRFLPPPRARAHVNTRDARGGSSSGCKLPDLDRSRGERFRARERSGEGDVGGDDVPPHCETPWLQCWLQINSS